jgi:hypothetical protein
MDMELGWRQCKLEWGLLCRCRLDVIGVVVREKYFTIIIYLFIIFIRFLKDNAQSVEVRKWLRISNNFGSMWRRE